MQLIDMNTRKEEYKFSVVKELVEFGIDKLGISDVELKVQLYRESADITSASLDKTGLNGSTFVRNNGYVVQVVVNDRNITEIAATIFHELTHVKQFAKMNLSDHLDKSIPYKDRWWEKEAFDNEVELINKFILEMRK